MSADYLQHGWRHSRREAGGTDPIPAGVDHEWALVHGALSGGGPTTSYIDLTAFTAYPDNDNTGLFSLQLGTGPLAAIHGLALHESGVYKGWWAFDFSSATNGETLVGNYSGELGVSADWIFSGGNGPYDRIVYQSGTITRVCFAKKIFVDGPIWSGSPASFPLTTFPSAEVAGSGSHTFDVSVSIYLERVSVGYTTNLSAGGIP